MLSRRCDVCRQPIARANYVEVTTRVLKTNGPPEQDTHSQLIFDVCDDCVATGRLAKHVVQELSAVWVTTS